MLVDDKKNLMFMRSNNTSSLKESFGKTFEIYDSERFFKEEVPVECRMFYSIDQDTYKWTRFYGQIDATRDFLRGKGYFIFTRVNEENSKNDIHYLSEEDGTLHFIINAIINGADVDIKDRLGWTPMHYASRGGKNKNVGILSVFDANINARDKLLQTPLHLAVMYRNLDTIVLLTQLGADVEARDIFGNTPSKLASDAEARVWLRILNERR